MVAAVAVYAVVLFYSYVAYLNPTWKYYGLTYREPGGAEIGAMAVLLFLAAIAMPLEMRTPSSLVVLMLFIVVYIPTVVITLILDVQRLERYGPSLAALAVAFVILCRTASIRRPAERTEGGLPGSLFANIILASWLMATAVLIFSYGSMMTFVDFTTDVQAVYDQRARGTEAGLIMSYLQTYYSAVMSPTLIALGLARGRMRWVLLGVFGCVVMYMIAAQRTVIFTPAVMLATHILLRSNRRSLRGTVGYVLGISPLIIGSLLIWQTGVAIASLPAVLLVFRSLSLPGLTFSQYYDVFSAEGFTWWSHVKGIGTLVPAPVNLAAEPMWPALGFIVGSRIYHNERLNANANLFSGDGVAAGGALGVLAIGVAAAVWLVILDSACRGWDRRFAVLVTVPTALALTNAHLFTTLTSFGGLFWLVLFHIYKPKPGGGFTGGR